jgi:hypothetical protein
VDDLAGNKKVGFFELVGHPSLTAGALQGGEEGCAQPELGFLRNEMNWVRF